MALSRRQIAQVFVNAGGDPRKAGLMAEIAIRESGGRPKINNAGTNKNGTVDHGLWQVNDIWRKDPVVGPLFRSGAIYTPEGNAKAAVHILRVQGPKAWSTYNAGIDAKYLGGFKHLQAQKPLARQMAQSRIELIKQPQQAAPSGPTPVELARQQFVGNLLAKRRGPDDTLAKLLTSGAAGEQSATSRALAAGGPDEFRITTPRLRSSDEIATSGSTPHSIAVLIQRANKIDRKHMPYVWGGGHGVSGRPDRGTGRDPGIGFDCSGAVSAVLGVDPRVSGQFVKWGKPGRAPHGKGVTVYANSTHVFMEINGHFFGTSRTNPGGGAGWIPSSAMSASYLRGFTARHM